MSDLNERAVNLAYKLVPLPSGCSNCWGDLGEGCTDECRRSSDEHSEKIDHATQTIKSLVTAEIIAELERLETGYLQCLNCEGSHLIKSVTEEHIKDRIKYYKAKETQL